MTSQQELEQCQQILQQYRVNELHLLLGYFKAPKLGKKHELLQRCYSFLQNPRYQREFAQKIRELNSSSQRYAAYSPYQQQPQRTVSGASGYPGSMNWQNNAQSYSDDRQLQSMLMGSSSNFPAANGFITPGPGSHRVRTLKPMPLPFYDVLSRVLELKELPGSHSGIQQPSTKIQFDFEVAPEIMAVLVRNESVPLPRKELQLRFFCADVSGVEQCDAFPPGCVVRIDGHAVVLPNVIPTNKPNVEAKRPSRPVNITAYISPALNKHTLYVEWCADKRFWALEINHVERLSSNILYTRLTNSPRCLRPLDVTKRVILERLNHGDDDAISMDTMKISLLCPLGKTRMTMPAKGTECTHLQCFDLKMYLMMNEKKPTWKCAICDKISAAHKLVIDQYILDILQRASTSVTDVELLKDGSWRVINVETETLSDDDDGEVVTCKKTSSSRPPSSKPSVSTSKPSSSAAPAVDDVIVLDSDNEDDATAPPSTSTTRTDSNYDGTPVLLSPQAVTSSEKSDVSIICLDDSDNDCIPVPAEASPSTISSLFTAPVASPMIVDSSAGVLLSPNIVQQSPSNGTAHPQTIMSALAPIMAQNGDMMQNGMQNGLQNGMQNGMQNGGHSQPMHPNMLMSGNPSYGGFQSTPTNGYGWSGYGAMTSQPVNQNGYGAYSDFQYLNGNGSAHFDTTQRALQESIASLLGQINQSAQQNYYDRTS